MPIDAAELLDDLTKLLFLGGIVLVAAAWMGRVGTRWGWAGAWLTITGAAMSWSLRPAVDAAILAGGAAIVALQLLPRRSRRGFWKSTRRQSFAPWDQEAELLRLCHGDKAMAERLIDHEIERNPKLSRAGAALSAATRLRHDKSRGFH